jgi:putative hydrolase of the HAD superfamily
MIKAIIFDLFNTLTTGKGHPEDVIIEKFNLKCNYAKVEKIVCGTLYKDQKSYLNTIIKELDLPNTEKTKKILLNIFKKDFSYKKINPEMIKLVKFLKTKKIKLAILSNILFPMYDIIQKNNLNKYFDEILYSYQYGLIKPNINFFKLALSKLNLKSDEVLMIGDSLNSDIKPAKLIGLNTIHFKNVEQLKTELLKFSINLSK